MDFEINIRDDVGVKVSHKQLDSGLSPLMGAVAQTRPPPHFSGGFLKEFQRSGGVVPCTTGGVGTIFEGGGGEAVPALKPTVTIIPKFQA